MLKKQRLIENISTNLEKLCGFIPSNKETVESFLCFMLLCVIENMDKSCFVIELKKNSLARVREWASFINEHKEEALATLKNEGVTIETFFLVQIEDKDYLVGSMRAKSMEKAHEAVKRSLSEIDAYHQQFKKDAWLKGHEGELLVDLSRIPNEESYA